jgi:prephenate dehydrogenase
MAAPRESPPPEFRRIAVLGTGLIGGSFALAVRRRFPGVHVVGWDRAEVLSRAQERGAIHEGSTDLPRALAGADLVYVSLPVLAMLDRFPEIARGAEPGALVADSASTQVKVCRLAAEAFRSSRGAEFFSGHPMAGKEFGGIEMADADLFQGATYVFIGEEAKASPRARHFVSLIAALGARPMWLDAETHDWAVGVISHLPQMVSLAMAAVLDDETDESGLPANITSRGIREALRLAGSPYSVWRDIALTNSTNIERALDRLIQALDHLRTRLRSRELENEFVRANEVYKRLHELK